MQSQPQRRSIWGGASPRLPRSLALLGMTVRQSLSSAVVLVATSMNDSSESWNPGKAILGSCLRRNDVAHSQMLFLAEACSQGSELRVVASGHFVSSSTSTLDKSLLGRAVFWMLLYRG